MGKIIKGINSIMTNIGGIGMIFIVLFICADIIGRLLSRPVAGANEMAILSMIVTVYCGISYCEETKGHVSVELIANYLPAKYKKVIEIIVYVLSLMVIAAIVYSVGKFSLSAYASKQAIPGPAPIKIYPIVFTIFIGCAVYWFQVLENMKHTMFEN
jgi:TRAP-type C4-dicarboxylate transport system permease small subunit